MGARELLLDMNAAGMTVEVVGERLLVRPAAKLTDVMRAALRTAKPDLMALLSLPASRAFSSSVLRPYRLTPAQCDAAHAEAWDDAAIARFQARAGHILRHGFSEQDADDLAQRLHLRDVQQDDRVVCLECYRHQPGRCDAHRQAGRMKLDLGHDLAGTLQRCPGFAPNIGEGR
jgi:hypothetical protein